MPQRKSMGAWSKSTASIDCWKEDNPGIQRTRTGSHKTTSSSRSADHSQFCNRIGVLAFRGRNCAFNHANTRFNTPLLLCLEGTTVGPNLTFARPSKSCPERQKCVLRNATQAVRGSFPKFDWLIASRKLFTRFSSRNRIVDRELWIESLILPPEASGIISLMTRLRIVAGNDCCFGASQIER